jgi:lysozyme family protein
MSVEAIIDGAIGREGGYSNHPADRGGETMWGVTIAVARANGYQGPMRQMPRDTAVAIYRRQYVERPGFDLIIPISEAIAEELVDTGINMGPSWPSIWLQQWLNALNDGGKLYRDIAEDGAVGPGTAAALKALIAKRGVEGERAVLKGLNADQAVRYKSIARSRAANEAFVFGWLRTRVGL